MNKITLLGLLILNSCFTTAFAQTPKEKAAIESAVRKLDSLHAAAIVSGDLKEMDKYWTEDFIVTNPFNEVDRADRIKNGAVTYSSLQRIAEVVSVFGNTVVVMGKEIAVPKGKSPDAGKTINRRYTNVWMKRDGNWRLVARQASVICS